MRPPTPRATVRRLPGYWKQIRQLQTYGYLVVTSAEMARRVGVSPSRVRGDLRALGIGTDSRKGYPVDQMEQRLFQLLGIGRGFTAVMLGTESLGIALAANKLFADCGIRLTAVINSEALRKDSDLLLALKQSLSDAGADIAIINDRRFASPACCRCMEDSGITGVWNLTDQEITPSEAYGLAVENLCLGNSLSTLAYGLSKQRENRQKKSRLKEQNAMDTRRRRRGQGRPAREMRRTPPRRRPGDNHYG